jgi:transcriptional regulator with GAF, ATPase, and Fis domain
VGQVLEEAYRQASRLIETSNFYIGFYDEERQEISFPFLVSDSEVDKKIKVIPATEGIAGYMVGHKTSLLFEDDVQAKQEALGIKMVGQEPQSWLGVPLMIGDRVLGVMAVQTFTSPRLYDEHSREVFTAIGSQVAIALQNAKLFESMVQAHVEAEERLRQTQILQNFTQALTATMEMSGVIDAFFEASIELLGVDNAIFSLVDQAQQRVRAVSGFNVTGEHLRRANHPLDSIDIMADIIRTGKTELITGWDDRFDVDTFTAEGMEEWGLKIFTPVSIRQENVGLVEVGFREKVEVTVQETQVELLRTLIDQAAIALESVQRFEASQKAAHREQIIRQITEKMRAATTMEELIQTATSQLGQQLNAGHVVLDLGLTTDDKI